MTRRKTVSDFIQIRITRAGYEQDNSIFEEEMPMDARIMEGILKYLIQGAEMLSNAMQLALLHYQNETDEESAQKRKGGDSYE